MEVNVHSLRNRNAIWAFFDLSVFAVWSNAHEHQKYAYFQECLSIFIDNDAIGYIHKISIKVL